MLVIISHILKYLILLCVLIYTFLCYFAFRYHNESSRRRVYLIQRVCIFSIIVCGFCSLTINLNEAKYLILLAALIIIIALIMVSYTLFYKYANNLVMNNMCLLLAMGLIIISRLNYSKAIRQFVIMTVALIITFFIPFLVCKIKVFAKYKWFYAGIGIVTLAFVLVFSNMVNGSKLNVSIANYTFQPSEFVKILFVFAIAAILYDKPSLRDIIVSAALGATHVLLLVASRDLGSAVIFFVIYFAMLFVATGKITYYLSGFALLAVSSVAGYKMFSHVRVRVEAFLDPFGTIENSGYQIAQSLFAIGSGGFWGRGLGLGAPQNIPVVVSDFVFSAISEEFGVIISVCLILICLSNIVMFFNIAMRFKDNYYKLVALGLGVAYGFQVFLTIGGVTKLIPITGVTLPLVSYGGTSVVVTLVVFNIIQGLYIDKERIKMRNRAVSQNVAISKDGDINSKRNGSIAVLTYVFLTVYITLITYICIFTGVKADNIINNSYNKREGLYAKSVKRGDILLNDGSVAASSFINNDGIEIREYPYGRLFAHAIGYVGHGNLGVERNSCFKLLQSNDDFSTRIANDFNGRKSIGDTVITTLDPRIQKAAYDAMGDKIGAVYVTDVNTGAILALVSKPDFDPNYIEDMWEDLNDDENSALINRATLGLYPPGSTFKIVTALEYMKEYSDYDKYSFDCNGAFNYDDVTINCYHKNAHGNEDFIKSFAKSCNSSFANISSKLNKSKFAATCNTCLFNSDLPIPYSYKKSNFNLDNKSDAAVLLQNGIGQGDVLASPSHINLITASIANDGVLMKPYVVEKIISNNQKVVFSHEVSKYSELMDVKMANNLKYMMREVVLNGTATKLSDRSYNACGKTGSAEYCDDKSKSHAWFTGFAPYDDPQIAVTVICEGAGSGGEVAVPVAAAVFDAYFE